ncbi:S-layer protein [Methanococcus maripaludis]|uniref:S-layer protein (TIGR01564 family) n=1 Tax=Methanococcus maripaludis TaxID=39152 RepID=A0A8T4CNB2_METMI|nr:S-layer protein [Methanococcus maripaludis]MBM7410110.1 S-layer protein (TIGR01564 family) [Methanococcus maripaludis]MBP2219440.1 S-layer protein (TIGR01564 family) [Methanococcus maripaludis]
MAMSMKKIGAIAVGGAMVASALATGAFAAEKVGDVDAFAADVVADGNANVDIVVGSNAAALDVVSAANIAAKIGSLMFKEGTVEDGAATVTVSAEAESDNFDVMKDNTVSTAIDDDGEDILFIAAADSDYADGFIVGTAASVASGTSLVAATNESLGSLGTLAKITDIDPSDWNDTDADAAEVVFVKMENNAEEYQISKKSMVYASIAYVDDEEVFNSTNAALLKEGFRIPFLGEEYAVVKIDADDDYIAVGKEAFDGVIKEGESYDLGNGYTVSVDSVLKSGDDYKISVKILKDGKQVAEKFDEAPLKLIYNGIGVVVNSAWENVGSDYGYAEILITTDTTKLELGEEFVPDWEVAGVVLNGDDMDFADKLTDVTKKEVAGVALKYVGDAEEDLDAGDEVDIADYVKFVLDDEDDSEKLKAFFKMDESKEVSLALGQTVNVLNAEIKLSEIDAEAKEAVVMTAPIAVLDSEASLDAADKGLILVGGPVVNALTAELADAGLVAIDNESPATLAVAAGAANGNDVLVVAGGDRAATEEAAEALIDML